MDLFFDFFLSFKLSALEKCVHSNLPGFVSDGD